jgi:single-strand DNA-binding protein
MAKARSLNRATLIGNLTRDPMIRETENGVLVCTFGVATNTSWTDTDGTEQERAEFHNIVAFNKLAEICAKVLGVGMLVYIEGEIRTRAKNRADGEKYYKTEIKLNDMFLLDSKDRQPVGVEQAKNAGSDLMNKLGDDAKAPSPDDSGAKVEESSEEEDFNGADLF